MSEDQAAPEDFHEVEAEAVTEDENPGTDQTVNVPALALEGDDAAATWKVTEWHRKMIIDCNGQKVGKLRDVYVDVETDGPEFATVKTGLFSRHLTFVPLRNIQVGPDALQTTASKAEIWSAPDLAMRGEELSQSDESTLYHHFEQNYTPPSTESGRRLARR